MNTMSDDLLRDALGDAAATITPGELRPLTAPVRRRRRWAIAVPITVGAVLALAIVTTLIRPSGHTPASAPQRMTLASYVGAKYVLVGAASGGKPVSVHSAATGKRIAQVRTPRGTTGFWNVTGTGDNRTFFLTTYDVQRSLIHFYRLRLRENGTPEEPYELPNLTTHGVPGLGGRMLAATDGAGKIAFVVESGAKITSGANGSSAVISKRARDRITIVDPATAGRRAISLPRGQIVEDLYWASDGRHIAFTTEMVDPGLRVLDTTTGAVHSVGPRTGAVVSVAVDSSSTHAVALVFSGGKSQLVWYSLGTRKAVRTVTLQHYHAPDTPDSMGPAVSGDTVVVMVADTVYQVTGGQVRKSGGLKAVDTIRRGVW